MFRNLCLILTLLLTGCTSTNNRVVIVPPPNDPDAHVTGYQVIPRFTGIEVTAGIPALSFVPVIGTALAEAIKLRAGGYDVIVIPILAEDQFTHEVRVNAARARWGSSTPRVQKSP